MKNSKINHLDYECAGMFMKITGRHIVAMLLLSTGVLFNSCKKFVQVDAPPTSINSSVIFSTDATAASVMTGIYAAISSEPITAGGLLSLSNSLELSGDNLSLFDKSNPTFLAYYKNNLFPLYSGITTTPWNALYAVIFKVNDAIKGVTESNTLSPNVKKQLLGEAYFIRGFAYSYLTGLFGDVPLVLTTDYQVNSSISRSTSADVYQQIKNDLYYSKSLLSDTYLAANLTQTSVERVRPTKAAARVLLSRLLLTTGNFAEAEHEADTVLKATAVYDTVSLAQTFLKNTKETIWSLQPVGTGENTKDALFFYITSNGPSGTNPVYLSQDLMNSFEVNDLRKDKWTSQVVKSGITYPFASKYKIFTKNVAVNEYSIVLRTGELLLNRAEARARQGNLDGARSDLNVIRQRAGLLPIMTGNPEQTMAAVLAERRHELFTEWGHRWFDLKRYGVINSVMQTAASAKETTWQPEYVLYPIPAGEIKLNGLLTQNDGYPK